MKLVIKNKNLFSAIIIILVLLVCLFLFQKNNFPAEFDNLKIYTPLYAYQKYPLPITVYTNTPIPFILKNKKLFKSARVNGFIISANPDEPIENNYWNFLKLNWSFPENYLEISIAKKETPNWDDIPNWVSYNNRIKQTAEFAKRTGFKGLAINTQAYDNSFWNPEYENRYKAISDDFGSKVIYQRSREMIQAIETVFPQSKIIITPLGALTPSKSYQTYSDYEYWIHFVNGLFSTEHAPGFTLAIDDVSKSTEDSDYLNTFTSANLLINEQVDEKAFWKKTGAYNFIAEPSLPKYNYNSEDKSFDKQIYLAEKYSQRQAIIKLFNQNEYEITTQDIKTAFSIIPKLYSPYTKAYFQSTQTEKKPARITIFWYKIERLFK